MLKCCRCNSNKTKKSFNRDSSKKRGFSSYCKECKKEREFETKDLINKRRREYYSRTKDRQLYLQKQDRLKHPEKYKQREQKRTEQKSEYNKNYYLMNQESGKKRSSDWVKNNRGHKNYLNSKRRAYKLKATPIWANLEDIKLFYKECPKGLHVDHIIPLKGKNVSGFHILSNLQYLPAIDNLKKNNKWGV